MPQIRPITDLRNTMKFQTSATRAASRFHYEDGYGDLVVMSIETSRQWWKMQQ